MANEANWLPGVTTNTDSFCAVPWRQNCHDYSTNSFQFHGVPSCPAEDRAASSSRSHSQAEKRRRDRINAQLTSLRKLIPKSDKMDKAALLACAVDHIKDLKKRTTEINQLLTIPAEVDEVRVECHAKPESGDESKSKRKNIFLNATFCCEDRSELFAELISALRGLKLATIGGDIACLGGRIKTSLILCVKGGEEGVCIATLKQSLRAALSRMVLSSMTPSFRVTSRRQRFLLSSHRELAESPIIGPKFLRSL
ncbi:hypothetical protein Nepgr_006032 [Nepenthes gracilis]|uniref:BHLH domain-containing protein n=1 Tax=Nepenthes gracilis TaxID=150966 RepID=A0AAD3S4D5_NEPGR|nr:hypothetical protein Nepgr_006032 [Nepenthes gracilis]